jgi:hypothetical protein
MRAARAAAIIAVLHPEWDEVRATASVVLERFRDLGVPVAPLSASTYLIAEATGFAAIRSRIGVFRMLHRSTRRTGRVHCPVSG